MMTDGRLIFIAKGVDVLIEIEDDFNKKKF